MKFMDWDNFRDNIKACSNRTLLNWLEQENEILKKETKMRQQAIEEIIAEVKKRLKVDDIQCIRRERLNEKGMWEEIPL